MGATLNKQSLQTNSCMPDAGIWYHMNQFYSEQELSVAYTWVSTAATLAQVCAPYTLAFDICRNLHHDSGLTAAKRHFWQGNAKLRRADPAI